MWDLLHMQKQNTGNASTESEREKHAIVELFMWYYPLKTDCVTLMMCPLNPKTTTEIAMGYS